MTSTTHVSKLRSINDRKFKLEQFEETGKESFYTPPSKAD